MAIGTGILSQIVWTQNPAEPGTTDPIAVGTIYRMKMRALRGRVRATRLNQRYHQFVPDQEVRIVELSAWMDADTAPGNFDELESTIRIYADDTDTDKYEEFACFVEEYVWETSMDGPNRFHALIYMAGTSLTQSWGP